MDFGPKIIISVLLLLSLRKLWSIQVLLSVRQLVRVDRMAGVMAVVVIVGYRRRNIEIEDHGGG